MSTVNQSSLQKYTSDLLALENHFMNALKKQKTSEQIKDEKVIELLHELDKMTSSHVISLEHHVDRLGGELKSDIKTKIASFAGSLAGLIDAARTDTMSKMLRDDYTALSMITIGYTMLHTHALAEEDELLAELTKENLTNCTTMITEISKVVPLAVAREVTDDADRAEEIGNMALNNTQAAWKPDVVNQEPQIVQ
ncbi:MAG: hypothetical protein GVY08_00840 [Bacteroidetes bacterium]|jgi:ferritin-like metal-binding protein YciE|nr:hypothetical protein [Bacteroidota bacterium]